MNPAPKSVCHDSNSPNSLGFSRDDETPPAGYVVVRINQIMGYGSTHRILLISEENLRAQKFGKAEKPIIALGKIHGEDAQELKIPHACAEFWRNEQVQDWLDSTGATESNDEPTPRSSPSPASPSLRNMTSPAATPAQSGQRSISRLRRLVSFLTPGRSMRAATPHGLTHMTPQPSRHLTPQSSRQVPAARTPSTVAVSKKLFAGFEEMLARQQPTREPRMVDFKEAVISGTCTTSHEAEKMKAIMEDVQGLLKTPIREGNRFAQISADPDLQQVERLDWDSTICALADETSPKPTPIYKPELVEIGCRPSRSKLPVGYNYFSLDVPESRDAKDDQPGIKRHFIVSKGFVPKLTWIKPKTPDESSKLVVVAIPARETLVNKGAFDTLTKKADKSNAGARFQSYIQGTSRFTFAPYAKRLLGGLFAFHPKVSTLAWEQIIPLVIQSLLNSGGLLADVEQVIGLSPSRQTIENLVLEFAVESSMLVGDLVSRAQRFYISYDKADAQKGMGGLCKLLSCWDSDAISEGFPDGKAVTLTLDSDKSEESSNDVANAIDHSLLKLDSFFLNKAKAHGITSDSGGGGNTDSGGAALSKCGRLFENYLVGNCSLHNLNLEAVRQMKVALQGTAKKKERPDQINRDVEALIFAAFRWEALLGLACTKGFWRISGEYCTEKLVTGDLDDVEEEFEEVVLMLMNEENSQSFIRMTRGAETRWWSIGEAADVLVRTLPMRRFMARNYDDMGLLGSSKAADPKKIRKIAQDFLSLSNEPHILADLAVMKCFHRFYLARHMKFLQSKDSLTRAAGCQPFSIFVRMFLMEEDYKKMRNNGWRTIPEFQDLVNSVAKVDNQREFDKRIEKTFEIGYKEHRKMFARWRNIHQLAFLAVFSEAPTGLIVARHILGFPEEHSNGDSALYESKNHSRLIDLRSFAQFVAATMQESAVEMKAIPHVQENLKAIQAIANGLDIWDRSLSENEEARSVRLEALERYGAFFTNQQGAERANKHQNLCNYNNRHEKNTSIRMIATSQLMELNEARVLGGKKEPQRGKARITSMFKRIDSVHHRVERMRSAMGGEVFKQQKGGMKRKIEENFEQSRVEKSLESFKEALDVAHVESAREVAKGFDIAPLFDNKLQLGKLFTKGNNLDLLRAELSGRLQENGNREQVNPLSMPINEVKRRIIDWERKRSQEDPSYDLSFNEKFFKVRYTDMAQYEYKLV